MRVLIVYGSAEDHTREIAELVAIKLEDLGQQVELLDTCRESFLLDVASFGTVVIAGCVDQGNFFKPILNFTATHIEALQQLPTILISATQPPDVNGNNFAAQCLAEQFKNLTGLRPNKTFIASGSLRSVEFDFFLQQIVDRSNTENQKPRRIAKKPESWAQLGTNIKAFIRSLLREFPIHSRPTISPSIDPIENSHAPKSRATLNLVTSETVRLVRGESVCIDISKMFNSDRDTTTFLSMDLPDWLQLNEEVGEMNGTVPEYLNDHQPVKFSVYSVDDGELSKKAVIALECCSKHSDSYSSILTIEFTECDPIILGTAKMIAESGLNIRGYLFEATGLPAGLYIKKDSGLIVGTIEMGVAREKPYQIVVSATEPKKNGCGASVKFFLAIGDFNATSDHALQC